MLLGHSLLSEKVMDPSPADLLQITSMPLLLDWIGLGDTELRKTREAFLTALGNPKLIRQVVAVPLSAFTKAMAEVKVKDLASGTEVLTPLSPVEEGQVGEARRLSRLVLKLAPESSASALPQTVAIHGAPQQAAGLEDLARAVRDAVKPPSKRICASRVLDQNDDTEVVPMDAKHLADLIDDWKALENDGEEPTEEEEATSDQLASLDGRIKTGATPFVDFGVWRPYGSRMGRALRFVVHSLQSDGVSRPREINGPNSYPEWLRCWRVFSFAMVALKHASTTRLQRYADVIRILSEDFPNHWWIVGLADIKMRSEGLERVRRDCAKRFAENSLKDFSLAKPWDVAFREAALDTRFWDREVDKQVVLFHTSVKTLARVSDTGTGPIDLVGSGSASSPSQAPPGQGTSKTAVRKQKKKTAAGNGAGKGGGKGGNGAGKGATAGGGDAKSKDGKWRTTSAGVQICFAHHRGTCSEPCPDRRAHVCEWCRLDGHKTAQCPKAR